MEIPKLTQNQCLVLYSSFFERDHMGGGEWDDNFKVFESEKEAFDFIESISDHWRYVDIHGPFKSI